MRLNEFTTPTVAKTVKKMANGVKTSNVSNPGTPSSYNQTLNIIITRKLEIAEAAKRALGDMLYPRSSINPTAKTGPADKIKKVKA